MDRLSVLGFLLVVHAFLAPSATADFWCEEACVEDHIYCDYGCGYSGPSCSQACEDDLDRCLFDCGVADAGGYWSCTRDPWSAVTTERKMLGLTRLECGWFNCSDTSHTRPTSWVDIVGGISQTCEDHSDSFRGPEAGEWNMCTRDYGGATVQIDTGRRSIEGINQLWDRWPYRWRFTSTEFAQADICNVVGGPSFMVNPFATVYDLDKCWDKQTVGTIYWPNFIVSSTLVSGDCNAGDGLTSTTAEFEIFGDTGLACSVRETSCQNQVCSDLEVSGRVLCAWNAQ